VSPKINTSHSSALPTPNVNPHPPHPLATTLTAMRHLLRPAVSSASRVATCASIPALEYASRCFLPTTWMELPLVRKQAVTPDSTLYDFGLPEGQSLNLPVCACLLLRGPDDTIRPYTPVSNASMLGAFQLLIKRYPKGVVSQYLHDLPLGAKVGFKHIKFNVKEQYPFPGKQTFTMLAGGTGITPMYQALHELLGNQDDERRVALLYGSNLQLPALLLPAAAASTAIALYCGCGFLCRSRCNC